MQRPKFVGIGIGLLFAVGLIGAASSQDPAEQAKSQQKPPGKGSNPLGAMPDLAKGLREMPGCLGVELAQTQSGKLVIFAWFEDKKAAMAWYDSEMHQGAMFSLMNGPSRREPMAEIAEDAGPILTIASITPSSEPQVNGVRLPIKQIAIEMYAPLPGGIAVGGRFAPSELKVPGLRDMTPGGEPSKGSDRDKGR